MMLADNGISYWVHCRQTCYVKSEAPERYRSIARSWLASNVRDRTASELVRNTHSLQLRVLVTTLVVTRSTITAGVHGLVGVHEVGTSGSEEVEGLAIDPLVKLPGSSRGNVSAIKIFIPTNATSTLITSRVS